MKRIMLTTAAAAALVVTGCTSTPAADSSSAAPAENRAVVIMSGGGAVSPFTTPTQACSDEAGFLAAGNSDTALREYLLEMGKEVYTAPAMVVTPFCPISWGCAGTTITSSTTPAGTSKATREAD